MSWYCFVNLFNCRCWYAIFDPYSVHPVLGGVDTDADGVVHNNTKRRMFSSPTVPQRPHRVGFDPERDNPSLIGPARYIAIPTNNDSYLFSSE